MSVSFDLTGKVAVITGGGGILCSEMARQLAERGVNVAVLDLAADKAEAVASEDHCQGWQSHSRPDRCT